MEDDRFVLRSITDEIMYELMELSGQEYVDVYAATMKERLAAARKRAGAALGRAADRPVTAGRRGARGARRAPSADADRRRRRDRASPRPPGTGPAAPDPGQHGRGRGDARPGAPSSSPAFPDDAQLWTRVDTFRVLALGYAVAVFALDRRRARAPLARLGRPRR